ncbi:DNA gyrase inhibitor SbmC [Enterobacteriaceae bacterium H20N1]|uniref:DNA gyrase inhibitor n=1 Tax=Dryocola boscaweniae TaxID=2925397 RepID=A0A9X2W6V7_9ENTR|nr:DNA gyrase inhibitor SbmC [Dryocola boscaweniae]MCT4702056.1 DNA gyrase inhibitor SbmC [Dryocola boscaweniae]MCT4719500.1 DNA gyrase inhibitor SbmC [Dryocola boscaweniae]
MEFKIQQVPERKVAGFHMVGPWEKTVHQGFEQLALWVKSQKITGSEWLAVYYDNPDEVPAEKLRCDTVLSVPEDFVVPENSEGVITTRIEAGLYAVARARVDDNDFAKPWNQFFNSLAADESYQLTGKPCFEHYLNDGSESGVWDIDMYVPVADKR